MPTYEYECKSCSHSFEVFQSMSDAPLHECPQCGKELRRLINGGSGVIFKGSGFYVNDKNKERSTSSKPESKDSDSKSAGKPDGKSGETSPCASCPASGRSDGKSGRTCPAAEKAAG